MNTPHTGWISAPQACRRLHVSRSTLFRLIDEGELPAYRIGWMIRLLIEDVDTYRAAHPRDD